MMAGRFQSALKLESPGLQFSREASLQVAPLHEPLSYAHRAQRGSQRPTSVAVFGAGIAGLAVAHELNRLGYAITIYEANAEAGGFFRSARLSQNDNTPSEYSWHGFGPWYHNVFDLMKQIPFDQAGSVYDRALSRSVDFGVFPDQGRAEFYDRDLASIPKMFRLTKWDWMKWSWLMLKTWSANRRTEEIYSKLNAAEEWKPLLSDCAYRTWRSTFGPWIGSDWTKVSLHHAGQFFRKQLITRPTHVHRADEEGPAWTHGAGNGWLLLRGPSSEFWFKRWVAHLTSCGVEFSWQSPLRELGFDGRTITSATLQNGIAIKADLYVLAANPFAVAEIVARTPALERERELRLFKPLVQDGPHTQVSFRLAFAECIRFPRERTAVVVADSEFNLTIFAQDQVWRPEVDLGKNVKSLWTGTSCTGIVPGRLFKLPVVKCTKEQFIAEIKAQLLSCESLNSLIREANEGRDLTDFVISKIEVWHEWQFSPEGIEPLQPKWVTTTRTQAYMPGQATSLPNLFLAGAHTRTAADVWSIEAAVESGRRAAQAINPQVKVIPQYKPLWLRVLSRLDDVSFRAGGPHVLDIFLGGVLVAAAAVMGWLIFLW